MALVLWGLVFGAAPETQFSWWKLYPFVEACESDKWGG